MRIKKSRWVIGTFFCLLLSVSNAQSAGTNPLPSWNDTASRQSIVSFVKRVTDKNSKDFVAIKDRVATFDNDGTLWSEQPVYFQGIYAFSRIKEMAKDHPEWKTTEPFKSVLADDMKGLMATGKEGVMKVISTAHSDITAEEFSASVREWVTTAKHPKTGMLYSQMVYQPMLELMTYLRDNDFKVYIVSGGGVDFMRVFAEEVYGVPPEQVIGSTLDAKFEMRNGIPTVVKTGNLVLMDDKEGKPVGIYRHIGRRPVFAAGNSDGDMQMLQYTTIPSNKKDTTPRFGLIVHHTDADREWAYDRQSSIGKLDKALDEAKQNKWLIVDMKKDWKKVYPESGK